MKKIIITIIVIVIVIVITAILAVYFIYNEKTEKTDDTSISITSEMSENVNGYAKADKSRKFKFPEDYGSNNDYKLEWWYFTGNLNSKEGNKFGYQFTIFRNALSPDSNKIQSGFSSNQLYFAHFTISDISNNQFYYDEQYARGIKGVGSASYNPLEIRVNDWTIKGNYNQDYSKPDFFLNAVSSFGNSIDLRLIPFKDVVLHGDSGLSKKSNEPANASYYYSITRLLTKGKIKVNDKDYEVDGLSWFDREWSSGSLSKNQVGWDWFSIQLSDGTDIMFFKLRDKSGNTDFAKGTIIYPFSGSKNLGSEDVKIRTINYFKTKDGVKYPSEWELEIPNESIKLKIKTQIPDQELKLAVRYYEGSINISGSYKNNPISGNGYIEMTGYE
jgi:predicted secreted hydrolase